MPCLQAYQYQLRSKGEQQRQIRRLPPCLTQEPTKATQEVAQCHMSAAAMAGLQAVGTV